jgi:hypothetical protein
VPSDQIHDLTAAFYRWRTNAEGILLSARSYGDDARLIAWRVLSRIFWRKRRICCARCITPH